MKYDLREKAGQDIFLNNEDVVLMKDGTVFRMVCCDCGLVHNIVIEKVGRSISYKAMRNKPQTASFRKARIYICQPIS